MKRTFFLTLLVSLLFVLPLLTSSTSQSASADVTSLAAKTLTSLSLGGPFSVDEGTRAQFTATAFYSDGTSENVSVSATWWDDSPYTNIWRGLMTVKVVPYTHFAIVNASYTYNSVTRSDSQQVRIVAL